MEVTDLDESQVVAGLMPLAAFANLDKAIQVASAINRVLIARKPVGDPYRGLLASGDA